MSTIQRIAKNTSILSISQIISIILIFFYTIYIARFLSAEGFGILSFALAFSGIFSILADLGINTLIVREVARDKSLAKKYLENGLTIKIILSFFTLLFIAIFINLLGYPQETINVVYFISISTIITSVFGIFYSIFQANEKMEYQSLNQILNSILMFLGVIIAIKLGFGVVGFSFLYFISSLITLFSIFFIYIWKFSIVKIDIDLNFWKLIMKEALPYGLSGIFVMIYYWIDSVMLSIIAGNEVVGWYNAAYKIIYIFLSFNTLFIISIFPVMSNFYKTSHRSLKFTFERSFKYLLIISIPITIVTTLLANRIILMLYGPDYIPSIIALQILIWTLIFMFLNGIAGNLLGSVNKQPIVTKITGFGAILNILLNILLIPKFSYIGASFATVLTEFILMPIIIYVMWKNGYTTLNPLIKDLPKIIFSSLVMTFFVIYLNSLNLFLVCLVASITYFGTIFLTKTLDDTDMQILKSILRKDRS
ncbi:flippase [Methanobacterium sp. SMA-27]|uniref:flippase n=1 Tax=Methanobacterium sp. SMA-27 TaxID=1495336 RepID=UPI0006500059|nr:flippase [Methanobacterium sp. SMA-27]